MRRYRGEARALRELRVPQVVQVLDFVEQPGLGAAVITELVDGVSLREMTERSGPANPEAALTVLKATLLALAAAHAGGIGHRDCKPENVLVDAAGNSKLGDFGWTVRNGDRLPPAGMAPYLAPELWRGAGESPATDLYAATAVFFYCLAGAPPFTGTAAQLRQQHATAAVPVELVDPPLRRLIMRGMAKDPALRPRGAAAFAAELEALAASAYGPGWEERGRGQLAERVAAILRLASSAKLVRAQGRAHAPARGASGDGRRQLVVIASVAAAGVVVLGGVAAAVTFKDKGPGHATASLSSTSSPGMPGTPSFSAVADVTPPVAASKCATPTTFTYSGTLSATVPGKVTYRWVYSAGKPGPEQTVSFTAAGDRRVTGETVRTKVAGGGWGKIEMISPVRRTSNEAAYKLLCGGGSVGGITATATVTPSSRTAACVTAPPAFTAAGSITASKAETVTYYWARSNGANSPPATLTFTGPGAKAVQPLTISPPRASGSGQAVLVVTSPVITASSPAAYTLTCKAPTAPTTNPTAPPSTAGAAPSTTRASSGPGSSSKLQITFNAETLDAVWDTPYSGYATVIGGKGPYTWGAVTGLPPGLSASGNGAKITVTGTPTKVGDFNATMTVSDSSSPPQTDTQIYQVFVHQSAMTITADLPATATVGQPYSGTVTATGGDGTYTWSQVALLPPGLTATANGATLTISGTPTSRKNTATMSGQVTGGGATPETLGWTQNITVSPRPITLTSNMPLTATVGQPYIGTVTASGGNGSAFTWSFTLPQGLTATVNGATVTISGTPTAVNTDAHGNFSATSVTVSDGLLNAGQSFPVIVSPAS